MEGWTEATGTRNSLLQKYKVQGEARAMEITSLCVAVTQYSHLVHIRAQLSPLTPSPASVPFLWQHLLGRQFQWEAGKCKSLLLRWENPLCYIKDTLRGVKETGTCNTPQFNLTFMKIILAEQNWLTKILHKKSFGDFKSKNTNTVFKSWHLSFSLVCIHYISGFWVTGIFFHPPTELRSI